MLSRPTALLSLSDLDEAIAGLRRIESDVGQVNARVRVAIESMRSVVDAPVGSTRIAHLGQSSADLARMSGAVQERLAALRMLKSRLEEADKTWRELARKHAEISRRNSPEAVSQRIALEKRSERLNEDIAGQVRQVSRQHLLLEFAQELDGRKAWSEYLRVVGAAGGSLDFAARLWHLKMGGSLSSRVWNTVGALEARFGSQLARRLRIDGALKHPRVTGTLGWLDDAINKGRIPSSIATKGRITTLVRKFQFVRNSLPQQALYKLGKNRKLIGKSLDLGEELFNQRQFKNLSSVARGFKHAGRVAGPIGTIVEAGAGVYQGVQIRRQYIDRGYSPTMATVMAFEEKGFETTGKIAGAAVGAKVGMAVGATIGSFAGPVGTVVGGFVGGVVGSWVGGKVGGYVGDKVGQGVRSIRQNLGKVGSAVSDGVKTVKNAGKNAGKAVKAVGNVVGSVLGGIF